MVCSSKLAPALTSGRLEQHQKIGERVIVAMARGREPTDRAFVALGVSHGPTRLLEGLPQAVARVLPDRALSGVVEFGTCLVPPHQQENRQPAQATAG